MKSKLTASRCCFPFWGRVEAIGKCSRNVSFPDISFFESSGRIHLARCNFPVEYCQHVWSESNNPTVLCFLFLWELHLNRMKKPRFERLQGSTPTSSPQGSLEFSKLPFHTHRPYYLTDLTCLYLKKKNIDATPSQCLASFPIPALQPSVTPCSPWWHHSVVEGSGSPPVVMTLTTCSVYSI